VEFSSRQVEKLAAMLMNYCHPATLYTSFPIGLSKPSAVYYTYIHIYMYIYIHTHMSISTANFSELTISENLKRIDS
jgi:hypothetical protein